MSDSEDRVVELMRRERDYRANKRLMEKKAKEKRDKIFHLIDLERQRQDKIWGGEEHDRGHEIGSWLTYMRSYLQEADNAITHRATGKSVAISHIIKVVALGVACLESHIEEE